VVVQVSAMRADVVDRDLTALAHVVRTRLHDTT
jgi:hypothetical protein